MSGILAWAADVVGGAGAANDDEADDARAVASAAMTPEQRLRAADLDAKAASLRRSIHDLRLRVPPPHVAQRLPHLHAHSLASSAALALQLNAHSSTKEQQSSSCNYSSRAGCYLHPYLKLKTSAATCFGSLPPFRIAADLRFPAISAMTTNMRPNDTFNTISHKALQREITLQEENAAYEKAISNCRQKIQEKQMEVTLLRSNLKEMEISEQDLKAQLDNAQNEQYASQNKASAAASDNTGNALMEAESLINLKSNDLKEKNEELKLLESSVRVLEMEWSVVEGESLKNPTPAQREKVLEKQLHSLIEQLTAKQAQAEGLIVDVHAKEKELERLNNLHKNLQSRNNDGSVARNPFRAVHEDSDAKAVRRPYQFGLRTEGLKRLMILRGDTGGGHCRRANSASPPQGRRQQGLLLPQGRGFGAHDPGQLLGRRQALGEERDGLAAGVEGDGIGSWVDRVAMARRRHWSDALPARSDTLSSGSGLPGAGGQPPVLAATARRRGTAAWWRWHRDAGSGTPRQISPTLSGSGLPGAGGKPRGPAARAWRMRRKRGGSGATVEVGETAGRGYGGDGADI
ncbi:hypothetical protein OsJ_28361 [Oryza sativa Japonica Group]|uniref:Uncharacterized protein n=1 Tax=Oryza sativa subsp. japonica TaxID=39947 RepID=B9G237_ORYSJ|nr:hypothetical protein OsJ_28361 [Oryza sativa Japonica Group]